MRLLITGICGFVGCALVEALRATRPDWRIYGPDNLSRPGSETNRARLRGLGAEFFYGDVRSASDVDALPAADFVIDAAANPSVLAGVDGQSSSRQVVEHNLFGTVNLLDYCRRHDAGFLLLSTSRVYSIAALAALKKEDAKGVSEIFPTTPPVSLYGATKLASEALALEYGASFGFPVWVDRCGVLAGAGQFGQPEQGILAYWLNAYLRRQPLRYIGFGGKGEQVRDAFHPRDLATLLVQQIETPRDDESRPRLINLGGGTANAFSLASLSAWCERRFGFAHPIGSDPAPRRFDIPWLVMDNALAEKTWGWSPRTSLEEILEEIAAHAERHPDWLQLSSPR